MTEGDIALIVVTMLTILALPIEPIIRGLSLGTIVGLMIIVKLQ